MQIRVYKNKWFNRWARGEGISDKALFVAAKETAQGKVEADLGGYLFKKRLPRASGGKSGGYRTILGYRRPDSKRIIFLYAFAKNERSNVSTKEEAALSLVAEAFLSATDQQVDDLIAQGEIWEVEQ